MFLNQQAQRRTRGRGMVEARHIVLCRQQHRDVVRDRLRRGGSVGSDAGALFKLGAPDFNRIADLESREVLLSKLAGAMKAKQSAAAALFAAPLAKAARAFGALQAKTPAAAAAPQAPAAPAAGEETSAVAEETDAG